MLLGAVISSLLVAAQCVYSPTDDVVTLTPSNFQREVVESDSLWLVEFYAPWCGHCQRLTPEWKKAASALKGIVKVGAVDCDQHKALGGQYEIRGYPTIKVFGANKNKPEEYQGGRTSESIIDSALGALRSFVKDRLSGRGGGGGGSAGSDSGRQKPCPLTEQLQRLMQQPELAGRQYPRQQPRQPNYPQLQEHRQQKPQPQRCPFQQAGGGCGCQQGKQNRQRCPFQQAGGSCGCQQQQQNRRGGGRGGGSRGGGGGCKRQQNQRQPSHKQYGYRSQNEEEYRPQYEEE